MITKLLITSTPLRLFHEFYKTPHQEEEEQKATFKLIDRDAAGNNME